MKEARYFYVPKTKEHAELPDEEAQHALRVLRMVEGDELFLMDGEGGFHRAEITMIASKHCHYKILESDYPDKGWHGHIHLAIAPTKMMERIEWMVEKAVEIGIDEITFLDCRNSERRVVKLPRIEKIAIAAMKQSRKPFLTKINPITPFAEFIAAPTTLESTLCIAHCYDEVERQYLPSLLPHPSEEKKERATTILIGPEGDFSIDEVRQAMAAGYKSVSLGHHRLRTETAGLTAVMMAWMNQSNDN